MIGVKLEGVDAAVRKLDGIARSIQKRIVRSAIRKACQFGAKHGRPYMPVGKTKMLRKSLGYKVFRARKGNWTSAGMVGARSMKRDGVNPAKYAHLVDQGTKAHRIAPENPFKRLSFVAGGRRIVVGGVLHPGAKAAKFLPRIMASGQSGMSQAFRQGFETELHRQAAKLRPSEVDGG